MAMDNVAADAQSMADPLVRGRPPGRPSVANLMLISSGRERTKGTRADQGSALLKCALANYASYRLRSVGQFSTTVIGSAPAV